MGFLNAEDGTLLIGVADDGDALGLADDIRTLGKKAHLDGYEVTSCASGRLWTTTYLITTQAKRNLSSRSGIGGVRSAT